MDHSNNVPSNNVEGLDYWIPCIGMEFDSIDDAWNFWLEYGGKMGFNVRKHYMNKNNGDVSSRRFLCANEGYRRPTKEGIVLHSRSETRTSCKVRLGISLIKTTVRYIVHDFVSEHNHTLHLPGTRHLLSSQRKISEVQACEIDLADDSGIKPKVAHELLGAHVGGSTNLGYTHLDHKNYLRTKRQRELEYGEAGILLNYFHLQTIDNPSFQYSIQLDSEEKITNIFRADARMLIDYALFGDVIAFDTTFGTNKENRPLGVFVGFNHFREIVILGVALLYDETADSFKWLFETFLSTHDNKPPKTIFTDQDIGMGKAIKLAMPETWRGLCTWHIMENAGRHLMHAGSDVLKDFRACMYEHDEETTFVKAFDDLREKVQVEKHSWLNSIYAVKEKWAECYMKNVFSLGMRSTQLCESFNSDLKDYLKCNMDIMRFFKHFERVLRQKRQKEINSEFDAREKLPRITMQRTLLLRQAREVYTPKVFEAFQDEYEWSTAAYIKPPVEGQPSSEYIVAFSDIENLNIADMDYKVCGDPSTATVSCSCNMFARLVILCSHAKKGP
ncbi:protein FAR1-RELATED SEQUENCE 5-like [Beta vulgaris subsp. vulgaris]|uniref:protein FAR1-RELATED SEQUENCE 5-like n=1 Tax=Beta vulgaris subsp. vulgaris TaxID=3555 RepID=UPI002549BB55|nr:protein FAR1-RELATED SEQUENCE 5-like [Beta vulgaris subsp. vulgaris]